LLGATSLFASTAFAQEVSSFRSLRKAVWAWHDEPNEWAALKSFCTAQQIEHIMLSLSKDARSSLLAGDASVETQLRSLKTNGISVWALAGEQDWVTRKESALPKSLLDVLQLQQRDAFFDGFEFDIEPHLLPQWHAGDRVTVGREYLNLLSQIRGATAKTEIAVTVVPSYTEVAMDDGNSLLWHVVRTVDRVSLMAYRDTPASALKYGQSAIEVFNAAKCPWRFGVLVNQSKESHVSFFGTAADEFKKDMIALDQSLRAQSPAGYLGLIFEDSVGLMALLS
jgi:hypothetical protein